MPEKMPQEPIAKERWRGEGILAWLDGDPQLKTLESVRDIVADEVVDLPEANDYAAHVFVSRSVLTERYFVLELTTYTDGEDAPEVDEWDWSCCRTLDEAKEAVEGHLFNEYLSGYSPACRVFDADARRELDFDVVQAITWKPED